MGRYELWGNPNLKRAMAAEIDGAKPQHAHIISGEPGTGRKTAARLYAAALVCDTPRGGPCGVCSGCRKTEMDIHPDVVTLQPAGKRDYKVEQIRALRREASVMPNEAARKVYIIPEGDALSGACQNAMLKLLEEPPRFAFFILVAASTENLLATVRSRCTLWRTRPVGLEEAEAFLKQHFPDTPDSDIRRAAKESGGRLGAAQELLRDPAAGKSAQLAEEFVRCISAQDEAGALVCVSAFRYDREAYLMFCAALSDKLIAAARIRAAGDRPAGPLEDALARVGAKRLLRMAEVCRLHSDRQAQYAAVDISAAALTAEIFAFVT